MTLEPQQAEAAADQALSPYLAARRTWNDHVARIVAARTLWQAVALVSLMIAAAAVSGLLVLATRSRFIPYVIEVDRSGQVQAVARADRMPPASRAVMEAQLEKFVTLSRRVTTDVALQRSAIFGVFAMLTPDDPATVKMTEYLNGSEDRTPFSRAKTETVTTEIKSILQQTQDTWQVEWTESVYARNGEKKERVAMQALVQVYQSAAEHVTEEALRTNPLGLYVRDFSWGRKEQREVAQ